MEDAVEAGRQIAARGHLVRDARVADFCLGTDDPLGDRRRGRQKGARDFLRR